MSDSSKAIKERIQPFCNKPIETKSVDETLQLALSFAKSLQPGDIICLSGDLGAGKTHFVKGVSSYFGIDPSLVNSPTFTLVHEYLGGKIPVYHFDFYRIKSEQEILEIGADEYFYDDGICMIEWPDKAQGLIPETAIWIDITHLGKNKRQFLIRINKK